jgi:hypothetical protein
MSLSDYLRGEIRAAADLPAILTDEIKKAQGS